jgi:hypothetical protein
MGKGGGEGEQPLLKVFRGSSFCSEVALQTEKREE